ncbi:MAG: iron ABC transporter permease [Acidimicrobiaceae bacterium]|nr:iron ABC transporter permease [Acidimicrobiia bacterium]MCY4492859.1 iron ABC transporter permease [Acidimicrobiaceae bacterium]
MNRTARLCSVAAAGVLGLAIVGLVVGDYPVPARSAIATAVWDRGGEFDFVINSLRFPRVTVAVLAGICLAASGLLFQTLIDNPLVSPDIIGIDTGAAAAAVAILAIGLDARLLPYAAFAGALATAVVIFALSWRRGFSGGRLVLVGIGINALLSAVITYMLVRFPVERVSAAARWQAGTLSGSSWDDARTLAVALVVLLPVAFLLVRRLRIMQLGNDAAIALGMRLEQNRMAVIATGCGLAAIVVAVVGPLGFVALLVPHVARSLAGALTVGVLLLTALLGSVMLLSADLVAQRLFAPTVLPAGVVTAAMGGPYLLAVLRKFNRAV